MKKDDIVCQNCDLRKYCKPQDTCAPMVWVDGDKSRQEPLIRDLSKCASNFEYKNYNESLAELIEDVENKTDTTLNKINKILQIKDYRVKAIRALQFFLIPKNIICTLFCISISQLNKIIFNYQKNN